MSDIAIRVEGLSKRYRISELQRYKALRDTLANMLYAPWRVINSMFKAKRTKEYEPKSNSFIWAIKDVSFEVKRGDVVGIIGRNGAGKSTLLKILSRITEPTEGHAELHGRVGSLLEVGTGFHPELTGRENIYLNGAILGMRKAEINRKFDEIVAFAEIEKFIDTPVKFYSSGMYVRLAFAVAAHLEPEILLVDEVLAVGDVAFQKKCLGKMGDVAKGGRTVLFVSHNMAAVSRLCRKTMWLNEGQVQMLDITENVVAAYLSAGIETQGERSWENLECAPGNKNIRLRAIRVVNCDGKISSVFDMRYPFYVEIVYQIFHPLSNMRVGFFLVNSGGVIVFDPNDSEDCNWQDKRREPGLYMSRCKIPGGLLNCGLYTISVGSDIPSAEVNFWEEMVIQFTIERTGGTQAHRIDISKGVICPSFDWHITRVR